MEMKIILNVRSKVILREENSNAAENQRDISTGSSIS